MAKGESLYARLEIDFMRNFDFLELPVGSRFLYLSLWCYSLGQRRSTITRPSNHSLSTLAGLHRHPIATYLQCLHDASLIVLDDTHIHLIGIEEKHKQFQWSNKSIGGQTPPKRNQTPPQERNVDEPNRTEKTPVRSAKAKRTTNPDIKIFIDRYCIQHQEILGSKYVVQGVKDGTAVKRLLGSLGLSELQVRAERFLRDPNSWPDNDKKLTALANNINKYGKEKRSGQDFSGIEAFLKEAQEEGEDVE